jgi:hypothetical protein
MPITYRFDSELGCVHTRCAGAVGLEDVHAHFQALEADTSLPPRVDVLLDFTEIASVPESKQLEAVVGDIRRVGARIHWGACAIVAVDDAMFGMSRMLEVFAERQFERTHVFRDLSRARNWLVQRGGASA